MIKRVLDFVCILMFVWVCMIFGLWIIASVIVPLELPGIQNTVLLGIMKVAVSALLVLLWLWIWREIIKKVFWRAIKRQGAYAK